MRLTTEFSSYAAEISRHASAVLRACAMLEKAELRSVDTSPGMRAPPLPRKL